MRYAFKVNYPDADEEIWETLEKNEDKSLENLQGQK